MKNKTNILKSEDGSITVLISLMLPIMVLLILFVANSGQLIYEKIRLKNTCDAVALGAANVQSIAGNEIGDLNKERETEFRKLRKHVGRNLWFSLWDAKRVVKYFKKCISNLRKYQDESNTYYAKKSLEIANHIKELNQPKNSHWDLKPDKEDNEVFEYKEAKKKHVYYAYGALIRGIDPTLIVASKWSNSKAGRTEVTGAHNGVRYFPMTYDTILFGRSSIDVKVKKTEKIVDAGFTLTQEPKKFMFASNLFGDMPELKAYAKAKPAGGNIYDGKATYKPVLVK